MTVRWALSLAGESTCRNHGGITQGNRPAGGDIHVAKHAHVLVRGRGVPVHEGDGQIGVGGGEDLHGENVRFSQDSVSGDVELVGSPGSGYVFRLGERLAVQPDVGAVVDAAEIQPDGFALEARRQDKFLAIPPGNDEGAVRLHRDVGKIRADGVGDAGKVRRFVPKNGSGYTLCLTSAATTVVGTSRHTNPWAGTREWKRSRPWPPLCRKTAGSSRPGGRACFGWEGSPPARKSDRRKTAPGCTTGCSGSSSSRDPWIFSGALHYVAFDR